MIYSPTHKLSTSI